MIQLKIVAISRFFASDNFTLAFILCACKRIFLLRVLIFWSYTGFLRIIFDIWILVFGTCFLEWLWIISFLIYSLRLFAKEKYIIYRGERWFFLTGKDRCLLPCGRRLLDKLLRRRTCRNGTDSIRVVRNGMSLTVCMHMAPSLSSLTLGEAESPSVYQFHTYKLFQSFEILIV